MKPDSPSPAEGEITLEYIWFGAHERNEQPGKWVDMENRIPQGRLQRGFCPLSIGRGLVLVARGYFCWLRQLVELCQLFTLSKFRVISEERAYPDRPWTSKVDQIYLGSSYYFFWGPGLSS